MPHNGPTEINELEKVVNGTVPLMIAARAIPRTCGGSGVYIRVDHSNPVEITAGHERRTVFRIPHTKGGSN